MNGFTQGVGAKFCKNCRIFLCDVQPITPIDWETGCAIF